MPELRGRLAANAELAPLTWFRVGGPAQMLFTPVDEADLGYFLSKLPSEIPVYPVGVGSNLIVRDGGLPIATGENLHMIFEFKQMIVASGVTFFEADVTNCGGVTAFIKIAHLAEAFNLPITSHGAHDITVQLLAAVPNRSYLEVHGFGLERFLTHPFDLAEGFATAPERPGHGVEFDWRKLETVRAS